MKKLSIEKTGQQAAILGVVQTQLITLDVNYLEQCVKDMKENLSFKKSASIMAPNPHTIFAQLELEEVKLKQLEIYVEATKNLEAIKEKQLALVNAKSNSDTMGKIFGL